MGAALLVIGDLMVIVAAYLAGWRGGSKRRPEPEPAPPRPLRLCSCTHGLGMHTPDGCAHVEHEVVGGKPVVVRDFMGNERIAGRDDGSEITRPCPCRTYDGEVPVDSIIRDWAPPTMG